MSLVKIWLCERQGGWLAYQCLEMPEELRGSGKLAGKPACVQILSEQKPYIYCVSVFLNGEDRYHDAEPTVISCKHKREFKQEILDAFDEWSEGLKVYCPTEWEYSWLIKPELADVDKLPINHPIYIFGANGFWNKVYFSRTISIRGSTRVYYSVSPDDNKYRNYTKQGQVIYLAEPLPEQNND